MPEYDSNDKYILLSNLPYNCDSNAELHMSYDGGVKNTDHPLKKSSFNFRQKFIESKSSRASCGLNIGHLSMTKLQQLLPSSSDPPVFATATKSTLK